MTKPKISVVLGTYNQKETLQIVLDGYNHQTASNEDFEVIVIDSSSPDGTFEMMEGLTPSFQFRPIKRDNHGKTAARNYGVSVARGDLILITDADMIPDKHLIEEHLLAHESASKATCFEGTTFNMHALEWPTQESNLYPYIRESLKPLQKLGFWYFLTGNISFPKDLIESEGGFSEDFQGYGWEDIELGYRLHLKNVPLRYLPSAKNYHYHVITDQEDVERHVKKGESAKIFLKKHPRLKWFLGLNPISRFIFPKISTSGSFYGLMRHWFESENKGLKYRFSFWFLKEHHYIQGILS